MDGALRVDPASLDFGIVAPGARLERTVALLNDGQGPISTSRISVEKDGATVFGLAAQAGGEIAPGGRLEVRLYYAPQAVGAHTAQLLVRSDAANAPEIVVPVSGSAALASACGGTACATPPGQCFKGVGSCVSGSCRYPAKGEGSSCDDGNPCTVGDACDGSGACKGTARSCDVPPAASCLDNRTQRTFALPGSCGLSGCSYSVKEVACAQGCDVASGRCSSCQPVSCFSLQRECGAVQDGCGTLLQCGSCATPPPSICASATVRRSYSLPATCSASGKCQFTVDDFSCPSGCTASTGKCAACTPTTCAAGGRDCGPLQDGCGTTLQCGGCTTPPAPSCVSATTRRVYGNPGSCSGAGKCSYLTQDSVCASGCDAATSSCRSCLTSCPAGKNCGTIPDGCGGSVICGSSCPSGETCTANVCSSSACTGSCSSLLDCNTPGYACDRAKGCCAPCGGSGQICCVDHTNLVFTCNSSGDVCGRSSGGGATENYYCCKNAGDGCCSQGGCGGGTCCKCPRNGLNACVQPSFGCGGC